MSVFVPKIILPTQVLRSLVAFVGVHADGDLVTTLTLDAAGLYLVSGGIGSRGVAFTQGLSAEVMLARELPVPAAEFGLPGSLLGLPTTGGPSSTWTGLVVVRSRTAGVQQDSIYLRMRSAMGVGDAINGYLSAMLLSSVLTDRPERVETISVEDLHKLKLFS